MAGLKKKGRAASSKLHDMIERNLRPLVERFSRKMRLAPRLRLFGRWGRRNPKRLTVYYLGFALLLISVNVLASVFNSPTDRDPLGMSRITAGNPLEGMQTINLNRELIKEAGAEYSKAYLKVAQRLDSLCGLRKKSVADSIEIARLWKVLNDKPSNNNINP